MFDPRPLVLALLVGCAGGKPAPEDTAPDPGSVDADGDGSPASDDCDDAEATVHPDADELCNDRDDDCDGLADEDAVDQATLYTDADGDGAGDESAPITTCDAPEGYAATAGDCDDGDPAVNPSATEVCDDADVDEDCSGAADDADTGVDTSTGTTWYADADGDGYGDAATTAVACDLAEGYAATADDCDDTDATISPAGTEICDGEDDDENCDGAADDADAAVDTSTYSEWYADDDGDGYGNASTSTTSCDASVGFVADATDCDDTTAAISPLATETCDDANTDEDCDGVADNDDPGADGELTWAADTDGDGYGDAAVTQSACDQPDAYVADATDCDDTAGSVYPTAPEQCDGIVNDCDAVGTWTADAEIGTASWIDAAGELTAVTADVVGAADAAVAWAAPSDGELRFCDGTFYVQVDGSAASLTISSQHGSESTVLDGGAAGTVVESTGGVLTLSGVTIQNGSAANGAGIHCLASDLALDDVVLEGNVATSSGGAMFLQSCTDATLVDVQINDNAAASGAGVYATTSDGLVMEGLDVSGNTATVVGGGLLLSNSDFTLSDGTVALNAAGGSYSGGGMSISSSVGTLDTITVSDNTAGSAAGLLLSASTVEIVDGAISGNVATSYGAGIHAYYSTTVTVEGTTFADNVGGSEGTVHLDTGSAGTFTSCVFSTNEGETSGVFTLEETATLGIVVSDFTDNTPNDVYAAGIDYWLGLGASVTCDDLGGCL